VDAIEGRLFGIAEERRRLGMFARAIGDAVVFQRDVIDRIGERPQSIGQAVAGVGNGV
jgi:hypothetical protein